MWLDLGDEDIEPDLQRRRLTMFCRACDANLGLLLEAKNWGQRLFSVRRHFRGRLNSCTKNGSVHGKCNLETFISLQDSGRPVPSLPVSEPLRGRFISVPTHRYQIGLAAAEAGENDDDDCE